jgi:hypothetical protein
MQNMRIPGDGSQHVLVGLPEVPARPVSLAADSGPRRDNGAATRDARGPAAVRGNGGQAKGRKWNAAGRPYAKAADTIQFTDQHQIRWILDNAGNGHNGYEAGKRAYCRIKPVHTPAEYEDFCRALARACGV